MQGQQGSVQLVILNGKNWQIFHFDSHSIHHFEHV